MKVKVNAIAMITMVTFGFTTIATSCSNADVPASYQPSVLAKSLEGEWIMEQHIDGIEGLGKMDENIYMPQDADQFAIIYHFYDNGTGWKELDLLKNGQVESILISRYESQFVYTVSNEGKVNLNYTDADGKMSGQKAELLFDGKILTDKIGDIPVALNPSTEAQINKYKSEADAWHGGSDDAAVGHALSASAVGEIVGSDGKAYAATAKDNLPTGVSAVAMVAYVGSESNCNHGLAIALRDEHGVPADPDALEWHDAGEYCEIKTPVAGGTWRMPSVKDWQYMFIGCGSDQSYSDPTQNMERSFSGLASKLNDAGGTALPNDTFYWTSTVVGDDTAWCFYISGDEGDFRTAFKSDGYLFRACLAF